MEAPSDWRTAELLWQCKNNAPEVPRVVTIFVSGVVREAARMARVD